MKSFETNYATHTQVYWVKCLDVFYEMGVLGHITSRYVLLEIITQEVKSSLWSMLLRIPSSLRCFQVTKLLNELQFRVVKVWIYSEVGDPVDELKSFGAEFRCILVRVPGRSLNILHNFEFEEVWRKV